MEQNQIPTIQNTPENTPAAVIDLNLLAGEIEQGLSYVSETKNEFMMKNHPKWTQQKVEEYFSALNACAKDIRELQVKYADQTHVITNPDTGERLEVIPRAVDPQGCDKVTKEYLFCAKFFDEYLQDHIALLKQFPELTRF